MYKITFAFDNESHCVQDYSKINSLRNHIMDKWDFFACYAGNLFKDYQERYFCHPENDCIVMDIKEMKSRSSIVKFLSDNKNTLKQTLDELSLDFDEEKITEF